MFRWVQLNNKHALSGIHKHRKKMKVHKDLHEKDLRRMDRQQKKLFWKGLAWKGLPN